MRILFVSHSFPPEGRPLENLGGMQRVATELYAAFGCRPDLELHPLVLRTSWAMTHLKVVPFLAKLWMQIPRMVKRHQIDVVLFSSMVTASLAVRIGQKVRRHGAQLATIVHGQDVTLPFKPYQKFVPKVFSALDAVIPVSRATGMVCIERGCPKEKVYVLPNGIDANRFSAVPAPAERRERLHSAFPEQTDALPDGALVLCSVGRHVKRKGFHWFIDQVMPALSEKVHYWLAGDGPMDASIQNIITKHGLENRVQRLGRISEAQLEGLYQGADLFIMPNIVVLGDMEGFGVVMLEAGLCGMPAIGAQLEGIQDVIAEGKNGHLVPSEDAVAFIKPIESYLTNRSALTTLGKQARQYTLDTFTWPAVAGRYIQLFQDLLGRA